MASTVSTSLPSGPSGSVPNIIDHGANSRGGGGSAPEPAPVGGVTGGASAPGTPGTTGGSNGGSTSGQA